MKLVTTTTYIGKDGRVIVEKKREQNLYYNSILPLVRQSATISDLDKGYKIVVSRLAHDE